MKRIRDSARWRRTQSRKSRRADLCRRRRRRVKFGYVGLPGLVGQRMRAPTDFRLVDNPVTVIKYFNRTFDVAKKQHIVHDIESVSRIDLSACIVLTHALIAGEGRASTSLPLNPEVATSIAASGMLAHLRWLTSDGAAPRQFSGGASSGVCFHGGRLKPTSAKEVSTAVAEALVLACLHFCPSMNKIKTRYVYRTLVELMSNTHAHASQVLGECSWWLAASPIHRGMAFAFFDGGQGIPRTLRSRWAARAVRAGGVLESLGMVENLDVALMRDAFTRATRSRVEVSRTGRPHRGHGLPAMKQAVENGLLDRFFVISGRVWVSLAEGVYQELPEGVGLDGTLMYFEVREGSNDE